MTRPARKMKPSGIPWIGDVPADWESRRFRRAGRFVKGKLPSNDNSNAEGLPIIGASEMNGKPPRTFTTDSSCPQCEKDDVLILWDGANAGFVAQGFAGTLSSTVVKYRCEIPETCPRYVFYLLKYFETYFRNKVNGTTIPHMNPAFIDDCALLLPPTETQKKIAEFLDEKCAEIDALIAVEEKMIAELKSYKQSVITEAVTRGVPAAENAARPLKDSGIPWLGSVPAHWEILPLKRLCKMNAGENLTSLEIEKEGEFPVYGGNGLRGFYKKYNCSGEYILVGRQGALAGNIHRVCGSFWATDHALITRCSGLTNIPYLSYLLEAMNLNQYALQTAAQPGLSVGLVQSLFTTVPPLSEQQEIVVFLDSKTKKVDSVISLKQEKIATLQNYKKSIIFEYVTGKEFI